MFRKNPAWIEKVVLLVVADVITIMGSFFAALLLRFDFTFSSIDPYYVWGYLKLIIPFCLVSVGVFYLFRLYHSIWSLASAREMLQIIYAYGALIPLY